MTPENDFREKTYRNLKTAYGDDYSLTREDFDKKFDSDPEFLSKTYRNLKTAYGDDYTYTEDEFKKKVGTQKPMGPVSGGGSAPTPQSYGSKSSLAPSGPPVRQPEPEPRQVTKADKGAASFLGKYFPGAVSGASTDAVSSVLKQNGFDDDQVTELFQIAEAAKAGEIKKKEGPKIPDLEIPDSTAVRDETQMAAVNKPEKFGKGYSPQEVENQDAAFEYAYELAKWQAVKPGKPLKSAGFNPMAKDADIRISMPGSGTIEEREKLTHADDITTELDFDAVSETVEKAAAKYNLSPYEKRVLHQRIRSTYEAEPSGQKARIAADMAFKSKYGATPFQINQFTEQKQKEAAEATQKEIDNLVATTNSELDSYGKQVKGEVTKIQQMAEAEDAGIFQKYQAAVNAGQMTQEQAQAAFTQERQVSVQKYEQEVKKAQNRYMNQFSEAKVRSEQRLTEIATNEAGKGSVLTKAQMEEYGQMFNKNFDAAEKKRMTDLENVLRGKSYTEQAAIAFSLGMGDLWSSVGGALGMAGFDEASYKINRSVEKMGFNLGPSQVTAESIWDPSWWIANQVRTLPMMAALMPVGMGAGALTGRAASLVSKSKNFQAVTSSVGGGAASWRVETYMEQALGYNDAIAQGKTPEEAAEIAADIGRLNLGTMIPQMIEMFPFFKKMPFSVGAAVSMTSGGVEELIQGYATNKAFANQEGREYTWQNYLEDPEAGVAFILGASMALPFAIAGGKAGKSEQQQRNALGGIVRNLVYQGSYAKASGVVQNAYLNGLIDEKTQADFNIVIDASVKVAGQTEAIVDPATRSAAEQAMTDAAILYSEAEAMADGPVKEAKKAQAQAREAEVAGIVGQTAPIMTVQRKGDGAPTVMTPEAMEELLSNPEMVKAISDGDIDVTVKNMPDFESKLLDAVEKHRQKQELVDTPDIDSDMPESIDKVKGGEMVTYKGEEGTLIKDPETSENVFVSNRGKETIVSGGGDTSKMTDLGIESRKVGKVKDGGQEFYVVKQGGQPKVMVKTKQGRLAEAPIGKARKQAIIEKAGIKQPEDGGKKAKAMMVKPLKVLRQELEDMKAAKKRGSRDPGLDSQIAEWEKEIALQEKLGTPENKGREVVVDDNDTEVAPGKKIVTDSEVLSIIDENGEMPASELDIDQALANGDRVFQAAYDGFDDGVFEIFSSQNLDPYDTYTIVRKENFPSENKDKNTVEVYRSINQDFKDKDDKWQFYAENEDYSKVFGKNTQKFNLDVADALDLNAFNEEIYSLGVSKKDFIPLTIGEQFLNSPEPYGAFLDNMFFQIEKIAGAQKAQEIIDRFEQKLKTAEIIKGYDAGSSEIVYAVKGKANQDRARSGTTPEPVSPAKVVKYTMTTDGDVVPVEITEAGARGSTIKLPDGGSTFRVNTELFDTEQEAAEYFEQDNLDLPTGNDGSFKFKDGLIESDEVWEDFEYALIESDQLEPSHNPDGTRNPNHSISSAQPKERNDQGSKAVQNKIAQNPDFKFVGENSSPYSGAPVINERGEVIQGNNRSIGLKMHYNQKGKSYKQQLAKEAGKFGLMEDQVLAMKNPILVRRVKVTDSRAIELGQYDVKDLETGGKQRIDPVVTVRKMSAEDKAALAEIAFPDEETTINAAIRNVPQKAYQILKGYLNPAQINTAFKDGALTLSGVSDIESIAKALFFDGGDATLPTIFENVSGTARNTINGLLKNIFASPESASLLPDFQNALLAVGQYMSSGADNFNLWTKQMDIEIGGAPIEIYNPLELYLAEQIISPEKVKSADGKRSKLKLATDLLKYNELTTGKPAELFLDEIAPISKEEAIKQVFKVDLAATEVKPGSKMSSSDIDKNIILSGLAGGFKTASRSAFDVRSDNNVMSSISKNESFATVMTNDRDGKKYIIVGLKLKQDVGATTAGRDGYSFAAIEVTNNLPNNILDTLTSKAVENIKSVYGKSTDPSIRKSVENPTIDLFKPINIDYNAIQEQGPEGMDVRQPSGDGQGVGQRNTGEQKPSGKDQQSGKPPKKEADQGAQGKAQEEVRSEDKGPLLDKVLSRMKKNYPGIPYSFWDKFIEMYDETVISNLTDEQIQFFSKTSFEINSTSSAALEAVAGVFQAVYKEYTKNPKFQWLDDYVDDFHITGMHDKMEIYLSDPGKMRDFGNSTDFEQGYISGLTLKNLESDGANALYHYFKEYYEATFPEEQREPVQSELQLPSNSIKEEVDLPPADPRIDKAVQDEIDRLFQQFRDLGGLASGFNPEAAAVAVQIVGVYIKKGVVKFGDIMAQVTRQFGEKAKEYVDHMKRAYLAYMNEASDDVFSQMDDAKTVRAYEWKKPEMSEAQKQKIAKQKFRDDVKYYINQGEKLNIVRLRAIANEKSFAFDNDTVLQEQVELAVVELAREVAASNKSDVTKFNAILDIYEAQPSITMRSSERIDKQQYSTPIPYAFLSGMYIGNEAKTILEPSAGNGALTVYFPSKNVTVNEIDPERLANLKTQGFRAVTNQDAIDSFGRSVMPVDGVILNPPFGSNPAKNFDGYPIKGLDEQMIANALLSMKDNGRAAFIMGGHNEFDSNGKFKGSDWVFMNYLYSHYNVVGNLNIDGSLYQKQGTTFPTRLILINGRKQTPSGFAPTKNQMNTRAYSDYGQLFDEVSRIKEENPKITNDGKDNLQPDVDANGIDGDPIYGGISKPGQNQATGGRPGSGSRPGPGGTSTGGRGASTPPNKPNTGDPGSPNDGKGGVGSGNNNQRPVPGETKGVPPKQGNRGRADDQRGTGGSFQPDQPSRLPTRIKPDDLLKEKAPYYPVSQNKPVDSVIPTPMATATEASLFRIQEEYGNLDKFVYDELGYDSPDVFKKAFSAEQVDAIALAIYQSKRGKGLIVGDMTGVGKGRIAAGLLRWGVKQGKTPIFLSESPNLFNDLYRDLNDIGSADLVPFFVNGKDSGKSPKVYDPNDKSEQKAVLYEPSTKEEQNKVFKSRELPSNFNIVLATYSQFRGAKETDKKAWLASVANDNIIILDEAHNASGKESNTNIFMSEVVAGAKSATFLSATFAKSPSNIPIYSLKTDISEANMSTEDLIDAISRGGVALQEIISRSLVDSGQMIRRERDFSDVEIKYVTLKDSSPQDRAASDATTEIIRDIIEFQTTYLKPVLDLIKKDLKNEAKKVGDRAGVQMAGVDNVPYTSKVFNIINQMLFSIKAKKAAELAVEELKKGNKVAIGFESTMESFMDYMELRPGDVLPNTDFSSVLKRGLEGVLRYTETDHIGKSKVEYMKVTDLPESAQQFYKLILSKIGKASSGISFSPIDVMRKVFKDAGYNVKEMTGRDIVLNINDNGSAEVVSRGKKEKDINLIADQFNDGNVDALLINASSATGISLHASEKFKNQQKRVLLTVQMQLDVAKETQKRGRFDRTGMVTDPVTGKLRRAEYGYISSDIPAETRLQMMFRRKMKSMDANTNASQKNRLIENDLDDILNKHGDKVILQYLAEHPELNLKLLEPVDPLPSPEEVESMTESSFAGVASKVTSRVAILPVKDQEKFYNEVSERYRDHIEFLNSNNANDLQVETLPLNATTVESDVAIVGKGGRSDFGKDSVLEKIESDVLRKPLRKAEVQERLNEYLENKTPDEYRRSVLDFIDDNSAQFKESKIEEVKETYRQKIEAKKEAGERLGKPAEQISEEVSYLEESMAAAIEVMEHKLEKAKTAITNAVNFFRSGKAYPIPMSIDADEKGGIGKGVFLGFDFKENPTSTLTPSSVKLKFATTDSRRVVTVPISKETFINSIVANASFMQNEMEGISIDNWDNVASDKLRETRYMITGNILQAFPNFKGQLVYYTNNEGVVKSGIMLPSNFKPESLTKVKVPVSKTLDIINSDGSIYVMTGIGYDSKIELMISKLGGQYEIQVDKTTKNGGKYFLDPDLRSLVVGSNFTQRGNNFVAKIQPENIQKVLDLLTNKHNASIEIDKKPSPGKVEEAKAQFNNAIDDVKKAWKDLNGDGQNLGIMSADPDKAARDHYKLHMKLVDLSTAALKYGLTKLEDLAAKLKMRVTKSLELAWDDAKERLLGNPPIVSDYTYFLDKLGDHQQEVYEKQEEEYKKLQVSTGKKVAKWMRQNFDDTRSNVRSFVEGLGGPDAFMLKVNVSGASYAANSFFRRKASKIFGGLNNAEETQLNGMIQAVRTIEIDEYRDKLRENEEARLIAEFTNKNGVAPTGADLDTIKAKALRAVPIMAHPDGTNQFTAKSWLADREKESPELYKKLGDRADEFFKAMKELLKKRLDQGQISQEAYDNMIHFNYAKRVFLGHLYDNITEGTDIRSGPKSSSVNDIKSLKDGDIDSLFNHARYLLMATTNSTYQSLANNQANRALYNLIEDNPGNEKAFIQTPIGTDQDGNLTYPPAPHGFTQLYSFHDGVKKAMAIENGLAEEWVGLAPYIDQAWSNVIRITTGGALLRAFATGVANQFFFLTNLPRDSFYNTFFTNTYGPSFTIGFIKAAGQMLRVAPDVFMRGMYNPDKSQYNKAIEQGLMMNFLTNQGRGVLSSQLKISKGSMAWEAVVNAFEYLSLTFEMIPRMALRQQEIDNRTSALESKLGRKLDPKDVGDAALIDQIERIATGRARDVIDFSQGGRAVKAMDTAIPYANAATLAFRNAAKFSVKNPATTGLRTAELAGWTTALMMYTLGAYEDDYENDISNDEKARHWIIMLPFTKIDETTGERVRYYFAIAKSQEIAPIAAVAEETYNYQKTGKFNWEKVGRAFDTATPPYLDFNLADPTLDPLQNIARVGVSMIGSVPAVGAYMAMEANYDNFTKEKIWKGNDRIYNWLKYTEGKTQKMFIDLGKKYDLSPDQIKRGVGKIVTDVDKSFWSSGILYGYDVITNAMSPEEKQEFDDAAVTGMEKALGAPLKRILRTTRPGINDKHLDQLSEAIQAQESMSYLRSKEKKKYLEAFKRGEPLKIYARSKREISTMINDAIRTQLDWDGEKKMLMQLNVENGMRAQYIYQRMKGFDNQEDANKWMNELIIGGAITKRVWGQIQIIGLVEGQLTEAENKTP
jgi:hypothetical protein